MTATATVEALLADLSKDVGEALALDADGACLLQRDDGQEVVVTACDVAEAAIFFAPLCAAVADDRAGLFAMLLEKNLYDDETRGAAIGYDSHSNLLSLRHREPIATLNADGLRSIIHNMLETAATLNERIAAFISGAGVNADPGAPDDPDAAPRNPDGARFA